MNARSSGFVKAPVGPPSEGLLAQNWGARACFQSFPQDIRSPPAPLIKGGAILKVPLF
ncbi:hypothetical protein LYNGBM3L_41510 [Moorena producens 3L]|uniref:Uncharacterized protein n=1 Tax=Moorena producens 3L TaxID=489825 RepID=F4XVM8_9CYAN|nr:hypothetical protein LYNGBM3L_41510 [Moorena producens 3L]